MDETPLGDPILVELRRIAGDRNAEQLRDFFMILPLTSEVDALAFLRTVPEGATPSEMQRMVVAYRAEHRSI